MVRSAQIPRSIVLTFGTTFSSHSGDSLNTLKIFVNMKWEELEAASLFEVYHAVLLSTCFGAL